LGCKIERIKEGSIKESDYMAKKKSTKKKEKKVKRGKTGAGKAKKGAKPKKKEEKKPIKTSIQINSDTRDRLYKLKFRKSYDMFLEELCEMYEEECGD
jgi:hypothetical protein